MEKQEEQLFNNFWKKFENDFEKILNEKKYYSKKEVVELIKIIIEIFIKYSIKKELIKNI